MTMKVYYINKVWAMVAKYSLCVFTLVGSMIVSSCSNEDALVDIDDMDCAISFGPSEIEQVQDQETRALFHNKEEFCKNGRQMLVCSYKYETDDFNSETKRQAVFENQVVTYSKASEATDGLWTYSPTKYWDRNLYYRYVAQAPVVATSGTTGTYSTYDTSSFINTIHNFPQWQVVDANTMDLMFAYRKGRYAPGSGSNAFPNGSVSFSFHHVLSQITVQAYTPEKAFDKKFKIKKIEYGAAGDGLQVPNGSKTANYVADVKTAKDDYMNASWTDISYADSYTAFEKADGEEVQYVDMTQSGASPNHIVSNVCVPFNPYNGLTLKVTYTYDNNERFATLLLNGDEITGSDPKAYMPSLKILEADHNYVITLSMMTNLGEPIQVDVDVADWEDVEINHTVYNW